MKLVGQSPKVTLGTEDTLHWVVATQIFVIFTPKIGEDVQFDEHIFQMGCFNHQPVQLLPLFFRCTDKNDEIVHCDALLGYLETTSSWHSFATLHPDTSLNYPFGGESNNTNGNFEGFPL